MQPPPPAARSPAPDADLPDRERVQQHRKLVGDLQQPACLADGRVEHAHVAVLRGGAGEQGSVAPRRLTSSVIAAACDRRAIAAGTCPALRSSLPCMRSTWPCSAADRKSTRL